MHFLVHFCFLKGHFITGIFTILCNYYALLKQDFFYLQGNSRKINDNKSDAEQTVIVADVDSKNDVEQDDAGETTDDTDEISQVTLIIFNHLNVLCTTIFV